MDNESLSKKENSNINAKPAEKVYLATAQSMEELVKSFEYYSGIKGIFSDGKAKTELKKRYMLKAIDEVWVKAIEDTLPALDMIIRNPSMLLVERENVMAVHNIRRVTSKAIQHLAMHTDYIDEIRPDGTVLPSKLLNVYQDETVVTYENRFVCTLLSRVYAFVSRRFDLAEECGEDEKNTTFDIEQNFAFDNDEKRGKIHLTIEFSEKPHEHEVVRNYIYTSDLWGRVQKVYKIITSYMDSDLVHQVGKNYVHAPIMRTNKLLKNVEFHQCLLLWEFLDQYENTGYETLIQEDLEEISEDCIKDMFNTIAMQYVVFQEHIRNEFDEEHVLDRRITEDVIKPEMKQELDPFNERDYDYRDVVADKAPEEKITETGMEDDIEEAILIALAADSIYVAEEADEEEQSVIDEDKIVFKYRHSFLSRLIQAQNPTQTSYTEIKNELLAYEKVKSKISWSHDAFSAGRIKCARMNVKGKTLFLYLPLDPKEYENSKYRFTDVSDVKKNRELPFLLKIRSERAVKYAKELIAVVMEKLGLNRLENPEYIDYHLPYATTEELARRTPPLVKIIGKEENRDPEELEETAEQPQEEVQEPVTTAPVLDYECRYRYSFLGRLISVGDPLQNYYEAVKNHLLSFETVKCSMAWGHESFRSGRTHVAQLKCRGKKLMVYLPLDPKAYKDTKYKFADLTESKTKSDYSFLFVVKSDRSLKYAIELIDDTMKLLNLAPLPVHANANYHYDYEEPEELAKRNPPLVKIVNENMSKVAAENIAAVTVDEDIPLEEAETVVETPVDTVTDVVSEVPGGVDGYECKYRFSFLARLITTGDPLQNYYEAVKNHLLSFEGVKSSLAWGHESFRAGRTRVAQLKCRGKKLLVYLPLDPKAYADTKYRFEDLTEKKSEYPFLFTVKSDRGLKYAIELIDDAMKLLELAPLPVHANESYHYDYEDPEELAKRNPPLVKIVANAGFMVEKEVYDAEVAAALDTGDYSEFAEPAPVVEAPVEVQSADEAETANTVSGYECRYRYSFLARIITAGDEVQNYYEGTKNYLLSFDSVKCSMAWSHESFRAGRKRVAKIRCMGKKLLLYLPLDPRNYEGTKYRYVDLTSVKNNPDFPFLFKIKSERSLKYAKELIDDVMKLYELAPLETPANESYHYEPATPEELAKRNPPLVKIVGETEVAQNEENSDVAESAEVAEPTEEITELTDNIDTELDAVQVPSSNEPEISSEQNMNGNVQFQYRYSFLARLSEAGDPLQTYYETLKNYILSYEKTRATMAWAYETFHLGRKPIAKVKGRNRKLVVFLPVDAKRFENTKYKVENLANGETELQYPSRYVIKSDRSMRLALEIIDIVMSDFETKQGEIPTTDYHMPSMTVEEMLSAEKPLIKYVGTWNGGKTTITEDEND